MAAVVQQNDLVFEFASPVMEDEQQVSQRRRGSVWFLAVSIRVRTFALGDSTTFKSKN